MQLDTHALKPARRGGAEESNWSRLLGAANSGEFVAAWLALQATYLPPLRALVLIMGEAETGPFLPAGVHPVGTPISADLSIAAEAALRARKGVTRDRPESARDGGTRCVAFPVLIEGTLRGVIAAELLPGADAQLGEVGRRIQWGLAWIELRERRQHFLPEDQTAEILDLLAMAMEAPNHELALQGLANELTRLRRCDWAACGLVDSSSLIEVKAISHGMTVSARAEFVRDLAAAMQEAADQREIIAWPEIDSAPLVVMRAHAELAEREFGSLLSAPFAVDGAITGVMTLKFSPDRPVSARDREFCRLAGMMLGPLIAAKRREDRPLPIKALESCRDLLSRLFGRGHVWFKTGAIASIVAVALLSTVTAQDHVTAPATLEGAIMRVVTAPIQGYVAEAKARPGDNVARDELLARLDDRTLKVERTRWRSELEEKTRDYQRAVAENERARVQVLRAEMEQSQARIDLIEDQLERTAIRAPFEGVVVRGDLSQMLGAPVQRGDILFEVAPLHEYRIALKVDERDIDEIAVGQTGALVLSSLPTMPLAFRVSKLTPISVAEEGRNNFHVEAELIDNNPAVRPGMQGYAKVSTGHRKVIDIATQRLAQWLRMAWWRWSM